MMNFIGKKTICAGISVALLGTHIVAHHVAETHVEPMVPENPIPSYSRIVSTASGSVRITPSSGTITISGSTFPLA